MIAFSLSALAGQRLGWNTNKPLTGTRAGLAVPAWVPPATTKGQTYSTSLTAKATFANTFAGLSSHTESYLEVTK
jgi:hypothetical protein